MKFFNNNHFLIIPLVIFSLLFLPFVNSIPFLDGNINFAQSVLFFTGGFEEYFKKFSSIHPPLKITFLSFLYLIFGVNQFVFTINGYLWGILGIVSFYYLLKRVFSGSEIVGTLLLSTSPLFISSGIFGLTDYILTNLLIFTLFAYISKKYFLFILSLCAIVLVKETGLLIVGVFLIIEIVYILTKKGKLLRLVPYTLPFLTYFLWDLFLKINGRGAWKDWIFTETADKGTFYTIVHNILTLQIFNKYAGEHFLQLFFLNFTWVMVGFSVVITCFIFYKKKNFKKFLLQLATFDQKSKVVLCIISFSVLYALTVLTLQTYTIPRYALPIIPFLILWFSVSVIQLKNYLVKTLSIFIVFIFSTLGLFLSIDPIANTIWGKTNVLGEELYATNQKLSGNDGLTYNYQYLQIIKKRTNIIQKNLNFPGEYCYFLFPDPNNDKVTAEALSFSQSLAVKRCGLLQSSQGR